MRGARIEALQERVHAGHRRALPANAARKAMLAVLLAQLLVALLGSERPSRP